MGVINEIGYYLNRRDEVPNQELGKKLAETEDLEGIREIGSYLFDDNKAIASDCLKVLYELSYLKPQLMTQYLDDFVSLLNSKNNRMVWGAMIGLSSIAKVKPEEVYKHIDVINDKIESGSLITHVWGVASLIHMATESEGIYGKLREQLFELQRTCRPVDFAKRAERMMEAIRDEDVEAYIQLLTMHLDRLSKAGQQRTEKVIRALQKR